MKIQVIVGTTRPNRFSITAAEWFYQLAQQNAPEGVEFELVDLKEVNLPLFDEPQSPAMGDYTNQHTKDWSAIIGPADGYIFVTGEYNHGVPAALKNAIDFLNHEWLYKPVAFVSYGAGEGGSRSVEQLRQIVGQLRMYDLPEFVSIPRYWEQLTDQGFQATETQTESAKAVIASIAFWAKHMAAARQELNQASH